MIDIYEDVGADAGVDGFRIDTVKHVNMEFWQAVRPRAAGYAAPGQRGLLHVRRGVRRQPARSCRSTRHARGCRRLLDFGFQAGAKEFAQGGRRPPARLLRRRRLVHRRRLQRLLAAHVPRQPRHGPDRPVPPPGQHRDTALARDEFAHSLMYITRGQPVVYYGDEQGFIGDGGDQDARRTCSPARWPRYNDDDLIGTDATTADDNYNSDHPLYRHIADLVGLRCAHPTLPTVPRSTARQRRGRASTRSAGSRRRERRVRRRSEQRGLRQDCDDRDLRAGPGARAWSGRPTRTTWSVGSSPTTRAG